MRVAGLVFGLLGGDLLPCSGFSYFYVNRG